MTTASFKTGYLDKAIDNVEEVIAKAEAELQDVDFDTFIGTGFSGALIVPMLAAAMGKNFVLVRKPKDNSHHSGTMIGNLGERWIFVDDFVSSGETRTRVLDTVSEACEAYYDRTEYDAMTASFTDVRGEAFVTKYLGDYLYAIDESGIYETRKRWQPLCSECGINTTTQQGTSTCWECPNTDDSQEG